MKRLLVGCTALLCGMSAHAVDTNFPGDPAYGGGALMGYVVPYESDRPGLGCGPKEVWRDGELIKTLPALKPCANDLSFDVVVRVPVAMQGRPGGVFAGVTLPNGRIGYRSPESGWSRVNSFHDLEPMRTFDALPATVQVPVAINEAACSARNVRFVVGVGSLTVEREQDLLRLINMGANLDQDFILASTRAAVNENMRESDAWGFVFEYLPQHPKNQPHIQLPIDRSCMANPRPPEFPD